LEEAQIQSRPTTGYVNPSDVEKARLVWQETQIPKSKPLTDPQAEKLGKALRSAVVWYQMAAEPRPPREKEQLEKIKRAAEKLVRLLADIDAGYLADFVAYAPSDPDLSSVIDHAGNHLRLGRVTDIARDRLDDGKKRDSSSKKEKSEPLPKLCPECKAVLSPSARECSACGAKIIAVFPGARGAGGAYRTGRASQRREGGYCREGGFLRRITLDRARSRLFVRVGGAQVPGKVRGLAE
jgi:hypothetical protein